METQHDTLQAILNGLKDGGTRPPAYVAWSVASLIVGVPEALSGRRDKFDGGTTWWAVALSADRLVTVSAHSPETGWNFDTTTTEGRIPEPKSLVARARRFADISSIDVVGVTSPGAWIDGDLTRWASHWCINFADGREFELPPDTEGKNERIARMLLAKL